MTMETVIEKVPSEEARLMTRQSTAPLLCPVCGGTSVAPHFGAPDRFHLRTIRYELFRCDSCTLVWQKNPPPLAEMGQHYGKDYHRLITAAAASSPERWALQNRTIAKYRGGQGQLLDLGCSAGAFLSTMKGGSWGLHGIEISPEEARLAEERTGAKVFVGDIFDAPFEENSFDVITCFDVLEHLYEPRKVIAKVQSWLKPSGIYYVAVPNIASWEAHIFKSYWYGLEMPRHLFLYSPVSLRALAAGAGLKELLCSTPPASYSENSLYYLWGELLKGSSRKPKPLSEAREPGQGGKLLRQALRLTLRNPFRRMASWAGSGPALEMVFEKPPASR
jgi:SAM-dependent methyltransferase